MNQTIAQRIDAATNRRYSAIAKMEDATHRMTVAERNGAGADPADLDVFQTERAAVQTIDVELRDLHAQARASLGGNHATQIDVGAASRMEGLNIETYASPQAQSGRIDSTPLFRALRASGNSTTGRIICKALLQGVSAGNVGRTTGEGGIVAMGGYGAVPLVLGVQVIPTLAGIYHWNRVEAVTLPAMGAKQSAEGAAKTQVPLKSTPTSSILDTYAAWEKVSVQSLEDQLGLAQAVEGLLTGAVLRACDAAAWTAFLAGSTAVTAQTDAVSTIVTTAAAVATNGGTSIRALLSPADYATMMLAKADTAGSWMGLPPGIAMPDLVQSSGVPAGKLLVTSGTDGSFVALRQQIEALIGLDADDFTKNLRTILVETRMVPGVRNPQLSYAGDLVSA